MGYFTHYKTWTIDQKVNKVLVELADLYRFGETQKREFIASLQGLVLEKNYRYISKGAKILVENNWEIKNKISKELKVKKPLLRIEHTVPAKVLSKMVIEKADVLGFKQIDYMQLYQGDSVRCGQLKSFIKELLEEYGIVSLITAEEDKRLNDNHLRDSMPKGVINPLARYDAVKIEVERMPNDWIYKESSHRIICIGE